MGGGGQELGFIFWPIAASHWSHCVQVQVHCHFCIQRSSTLCISRSSTTIFCTDSLLRPSSFPITYTANLPIILHQLLHSYDVIISFRVEGRSDLGWSSTFLCPFLTHLCHSKICVLDITFSPHTSLRSFKHSVGLFFSFTKNFKLICCSIVPFA